MAYINPVDMIQPFLVPLTANINQGIGTGLNLVKLQNETLHNQVANDLARQQIEASKASEQRSLAESNRITAELARRAKVAEGYARAFAPITETIPVMKTIPSPMPPPETFTAGDPLDHLNLSPDENAAILAMPEPTPVQTGAVTVRRPLPMREAVQRALSVPGQTPEELQKLLGTGVTIENQTELTRTRDEANRIREEYQRESNRLRDEYNAAKTETDRQKIQNQWDMINAKIDSLEKIATWNNATRLAIPRDTTLEKELKALNDDLISRGERPYTLPEYIAASSYAKLTGQWPKRTTGTGGSGKKYQDYLK